jgi:hypothetical protein
MLPMKRSQLYGRNDEKGAVLLMIRAIPNRSAARFWQRKAVVPV